MNDELIDIEKVFQHWIDSSDDNFETMLKFYDIQSYPWALFLGHLALEKLLKAYYVRKFKKHAPLIHNLYRLSDLNELTVTNEQASWLFEITTFNLDARYDDYKRAFYKLCTPEFTVNWIEKIKMLQTWIKQML